MIVMKEAWNDIVLILFISEVAPDVVYGKNSHTLSEHHVLEKVLPHRFSGDT